MKARAVAVFTVRQRGIKIRVRVLPTIADVDAAYHGRQRRAPRRDLGRVHAFFSKGSRPAHVSGVIVLPANGKLFELVPHEVVHAVTHHGSAAGDDEELALSVGLLSARIFRQLAQRGIGVAP